MQFQMPASICFYTVKKAEKFKTQCDLMTHVSGIPGSVSVHNPKDGSAD